MNERIDRMPRQPGIKPSSPLSVFCDQQDIAMDTSPWRQREAVDCATILKTQKEHPPSFHLVTFSFPQ